MKHVLKIRICQTRTVQGEGLPTPDKSESENPTTLFQTHCSESGCKSCIDSNQGTHTEQKRNLFHFCFRFRSMWIDL